MKATRTLAAASGAFALTLMAAPAAFAADTYQLQLDQLNDSGASSTASVSVEGNEMSVKIDGTGFTPNAPHAQHLHGDTDLTTDFRCPTGLERDANGDGVVDTAEALPDYGDVFIALTTEGDTSKDSGLAVDRFPVADGEGNLSYERTIEVDDATVEGLKNLHIVQHGLDLNDNGEYDAEAGNSSLDPSLPLEATAPATCGMVEGSNIKDLPEGGVETGDGSTSGVESAGLIGLGGASIAAAAGGLVLLRRRTATAQR